MANPSDHREDPKELLNHLWKRLGDAVRDRASPLHVAAFCTIGLDGSPRARSIIPREVSAESRSIRFHTDRRSPKACELGSDPRAAMLYWDPPSRTQLRLSGRAVVSVDDAITRAVVDASHPGSLAVFRNILVPSSSVESPADVPLAPSPLIENVAVVTLNVEALEWLWLDEAGHRRCRFTFSGASMEYQWLVP